jgi:hypothetical protein
MPHRIAWLPAVLALAAAGCGQGAAKPAPAACTGGPDPILRALARAPGHVVLPGGVRLSACETQAQSDAEVQNLGFTFTPVADALGERARRGDARSALRLGYLIGAVSRGAAKTNGIHAVLLDHLRSSASGLDHGAGDVPAALLRGLHAGEARG